MKKGHIFTAIGLALGVALFFKRKDLVDVATNLMNKLTRSQFIQKYYQAAQNAVKGYALFPSVVLAQAILESGNGNSSLSKLYNNFFGIKAETGYTGSKINMPTTEYVNNNPVSVDAFFRSYKTPTDGFKDHTMFLVNNSRYKNNGVFSASTPEQQTAALQKAGYATDPAYASKLNELINSNNLKQYD